MAKITDNSKKNVPIFGYGLLALSVTHMLAHSIEFIHPAIFSILRVEFNLSLQQLGIISAIPPLCQAIGYVPSGLASDRFGGKKMMIINFAAATLGALLASQANNALMLIVAISLVYINVTIYHPSSYSFTTKLFKSKDRSKALGLHGAGGTFGNSIGPLLVSILIGFLALEWRQVYLLMAVPMFLGIVMVFFLPKEPIEEVESQTSQSVSDAGTKPFLSRSLVMFLIYQALAVEAGSMVSFFLVLYLQDVRGLNIAMASLIASGSMLSGLVASPIGGFTASRFGDKKWLLGTRAIAGLSLALSIVFPSVILFAVFYIGSGFFNIMGMAARSSIMAKLSPGKVRGLGFALFFLPGSIMSVIGPLAAGTIAEFYGYNTIFAIAIGMCVLELVILKFGVKVN